MRSRRPTVSPYPHDHAPMGQDCPACECWADEYRHAPLWRRFTYALRCRLEDIKYLGRFGLRR